MNSSLPIDRARLIRRSLRCFLFGLIGVIPLFGLSMAGLTFRLRGEIMQETGERWESRFFNSIWFCGIILLGLFYFSSSLTGTATVALIFISIQAWLLNSQYRNNPPGQWNPARHLVYWGIGLAYTGFVLSVITATFCLVMLADILH